MYRCESWNTKKAECQRTGASEMWCWGRLQSYLDNKEIKPVNLKGNQPSIVIGKTDAEAEALILWPPKYWCKELTHWKRLWSWEKLKAGEEGDDRGQDGWMASLTQWIWIWASSGRWWRAGKPSVLQSMGLQRVRHDWATEQQRTHSTTSKK